MTSRSPRTDAAAWKSATTRTAFRTETQERGHGDDGSRRAVLNRLLEAAEVGKRLRVREHGLSLPSASRARRSRLNRASRVIR